MHKIWFKRLVVFICLFSLLESAGISFTHLIYGSATCKEYCKLADGDDDATKNRESEESNVKEFWALIPVTYNSFPEVTHFNKLYLSIVNQFHLQWIPPVPTPPPNCSFHTLYQA